MEHYELVASATVSGIIPVKKYKSKDTGFTVCIANVGGPLVNGYFCLATEAHDDDGLPHTLEHLVFMGSEKYPYKGMLDLFANRCLAQGTNAWTDTDHTCYTMTTAGSEGFLNLLPIYLDHVLYPTLTDSAYITEVHHINGCGENAGVVYCEMQARENTGYSRTFLELQRAMYPGKCGYKSETGGIMKNLRESCSNEKVRNYHKEFYRPENLCLIITGNIEAQDVFQAMQPFEEKIKIKGELPPYVRPWMSEVPPLEKQEDEKHILFATEDESTGMVLLGWRGPYVLDLYRICALKLLFNYLTDTPVAPLQQELVEIDEPFCGDISYHFLENKQTAFVILADNVPKERLFEVKAKVLAVLRKLSNGELDFDMDRMKTLLHRQILEEMNALEDSPHDQLASLSIGDFLYSENRDQLQHYVNSITRLQQLKEESITFWTGLLSDYVIDKKLVAIIGDPSEEFMKKSGDEEKSRIQTQVERLGEGGLKEKAEILNNAVTENSDEPSSDLVSALPIPSTDSISFFSIKTFSNKAKPTNGAMEAGAPLFQVEDFPCRFYFYDVSSLFAQVYVLIETSSVPAELQMYLPLYTEIMFESPILKEGKLVPYEDVVKQLAADTLQSNASIGMFGGRFSPGSYSSLLVISFKVELDKYEKCVEWTKAVLFDLQFSLERLKIVANKMISDVANYKRNGRKVASILLQDINFQKHTNIYSCNMVRQYNFLTELVKSLDASSEKVLNDLESLRKILLREENFRFYVAANGGKLPPQPHVIWKEKLFHNMTYSLDSVKDVPCDSFFSSKQLKRKAVGIGSVESAFLVQTCAGVNSCQHPDYPAILVFIEYLCALEGPLWRQIRGCGYSYNFRIVVQPSSGFITFILAKATHVYKAYETAKKIIENFVSGETPFERGQIEAAISGTIFQTIEKEQTVSDTVIQNITAEFKGIDGDFNRVLLKKVSKVTEDDLRRVGQTYFTKLFDPESISVALCSHPTKLDGIVADFKSIGVEFEIVTSLEDEFST